MSSLPRVPTGSCSTRRRRREETVVDLIKRLFAALLGSFRGKVKEIKKFPEYVWFLASHEGRLYSGSYHAGNAQNKVYRDDGKVYVVGHDDESTRVYSLGGSLYMTSEGGVVMKDGHRIADLGSHYLLGACIHKGSVYFAHARDGGYTDLYKEGGGRLIKVDRWEGIFGFHLLSYDDQLVMVGAGKRGYRNRGAVVQVEKETIYTTDRKTGVRAIVDDGALLFGLSYDAEILSWKRSRGFKVEGDFPGFDHFGSFCHHLGTTYAMVVAEGGHPQLLRRDHGRWRVDIPAKKMKRYGVRGDLVNAAGFLASDGLSLYCNINTPTSARSGPGYLLRLK